MPENDTKRLTLGSLFSGSGGFELAAEIAGIKPLWNSEIEPFPMLVTLKRFPDVKPLGDVCRVNGAEIEPVDIVTFGSPCTGMSVAGKREGLADPRSGLFHQAVRVIKEMRDATDGRYPEYAVWENVPGAFSSNGGEDFREVLAALCGIKLGEVLVPGPPGGRWTPAGEVLGDGFSLAWRVLDAQYWGVPQRRRRIYLVAHFAGAGAGKILFESESVSRNPAESGDSRQGTAVGLEAGSGTPGRRRGNIVLNDQGGNRMDITEEMTSTLRATANHPPVVMDADLVFENHSQDARYTGPVDIVPTVTARYGTGGNNQPIVVDGGDRDPVYSMSKNGHMTRVDEEIAATLAATDYKDPHVVAYGIGGVNSAGMLSPNPHSGIYKAATARTIDANGGNPACNQGGIAICVQGDRIAYGIERAAFNQGENAKYGFAIEPELQPTMVARGPGAVAQPEPEYAVRRLTPVECARLQGFPDGWCSNLEIEDPTEEQMAFWTEAFEAYRTAVTHVSKPKTERQIRKWLKSPHTDAAEYKLWGNGVALPCVCFVMRGIACHATATGKPESV